MLQSTTTVLAIIGHPIKQVKSPTYFNEWFTARGRDIAMVPMDIAPDRSEHIASWLRAWENLAGCVVTMPYKALLSRYVDDLSDRARRLGAVNVIRRETGGRLYGDHVDGQGFLLAATSHRVKFRGAHALVIGCGGAGVAIADALCEAGVNSLICCDVEKLRERRLVETLRDVYPAVSIDFMNETLGNFDIVVNATSAGMRGEKELPLSYRELDTLTASTFVADVVTDPEITPLLEMARQRGCRVQTGAEMSRAQMEPLGHFIGVMSQFPDESV